MDDYPSPCLANSRPSPLLRYKRRRNNESNSNHSNGLETSTRTSQDHCSSTTITTTAPATTRNFLSALVEHFLLESIEPKDSLSVSPPFDIANLDSSVPPSCLKFIQDLQNEIHKISVERETLKSELRSAQTVFNILQSQIGPPAQFVRFSNLGIGAYVHIWYLQLNSTLKTVNRIFDISHSPLLLI